MKSTLSLLLFSLCLLFALSASAQDDSGAHDFERAKTAVTAGKHAYENNDFLRAKVLFTDAFKAFPDPISLYYLGLAQLKLNECVEAERNFKKAIDHPAGLGAGALAGAKAGLDLVPACKDRRLDEQMRNGDQALAVADHGAAISFYRLAFDESKNPAALVKLGHVQVIAAKCEDAAASLAELAQLNLDSITTSALGTLRHEFERICGADSDGDGIADRLDACPSSAEDFDGFQDEDGCPDLDNDGDGIADIKDESSVSSYPSKSSGSSEHSSEVNHLAAILIGTASAVLLGGAVAFDVLAGREADSLTSFMDDAASQRRAVCIGGDCNEYIPVPMTELRGEYDQRKSRLDTYIWTSRGLYAAGLVGVITTGALLLFNGDASEVKTSVEVGSAGAHVLFEWSFQ